MNEIAKKQYDEFIEVRRRRGGVPPGERVHIHHIEPKGLAPKLINVPSNLVPLTLAEHWEAHRLLTLVYDDPKFLDGKYVRYMFEEMGGSPDEYKDRLDRKVEERKRRRERHWFDYVAPDGEVFWYYWVPSLTWEWAPHPKQYGCYTHRIKKLESGKYWIDAIRWKVKDGKLPTEQDFFPIVSDGTPFEKLSPYSQSEYIKDHSINTLEEAQRICFLEIEKGFDVSHDFFRTSQYWGNEPKPREAPKDKKTPVSCKEDGFCTKDKTHVQGCKGFGYRGETRWRNNDCFKNNFGGCMYSVPSDMYPEKKMCMNEELEDRMVEHKKKLMTDNSVLEQSKVTEPNIFYGAFVPITEERDPFEETKTCKTCAMVLPISSFNSNGRGGKRTSCRRCEKVLREKKKKYLPMTQEEVDAVMNVKPKSFWTWLKDTFKFR